MDQMIHDDNDDEPVATYVQHIIMSNVINDKENQTKKKMKIFLLLTGKNQIEFRFDFKNWKFHTPTY